MNKKGMMAQMIAAFVLIMMAVAIIPVIVNQTKSLSVQSSSNLTTFSDDSLSTMYSLLPWVFGGFVGLIAVIMIIHAFRNTRDSGVDGGDDDYEEDEDEEDETDDDDDYEEDEEDEEEEEEEEPKKTTRSTTVITRKKFGTKDGTVIRTNVKVGPGYNVDKYALEPVKPGSTLTVKEENFKKTRFD